MTDHCDPRCPFRRDCPDCPWSGENPTAATVSDARTGVCQLCAHPVDPTDVHLDHIMPFSKGGQTIAGNLQVTHSVCNMRKGARV